jgi:hypothetical protein
VVRIATAVGVPGLGFQRVGAGDQLLVSGAQVLCGPLLLLLA